MKSVYPRLYRRNHSFYIRVGVPRKLQPIVKKKEIRYSLKTNDYYQGLIEVRKYSYLIDSYFQKVGRLLKMKIEKKKLILDENDIFYTQKAKLKEGFEDIKKMTLSHDESEVKKWFITQIDNLEETKDTDKINEIKKALKKDNTINIDILFEILVPIIDYQIGTCSGNKLKIQIKNELEKSHFIPKLANDSKSKQLLGLLKAMEEEEETPKDIEVILQSIHQDLIEKVNNSKLEPENTKETLENCLDHFFEEKRSENRDEEGIKNSRKRLNKMFNLVKIKYIDEIKDFHCRKIDREVREFKNEINKEEKISDKTISDRLSLFKSFLKFCRKKQYIVSNFDDIIEPPSASNMKQIKILPYTDKEIEKLFTSPLILETRYDSKQFHLFWVSIIALYTGCRLNEICQLNIDDIIIENGIKCFNITIENDNNDKKKRLKNKYSERKVPIHPFLIKIGFLDFYEKVKNSKNYVNKWFKKNNRKIEIKKKGIVVKKIDSYNKNNLFFILSYTTNNKHGGKVSNSFSKIKRKLFPGRENVRFHSLRHSFTTNLANWDVSRNTIDDLTGHRKQGEGETYIGDKNKDRERTKTFKKTVEKVSYLLLEKHLKKFLFNPKKEKDFLK